MNTKPNQHALKLANFTPYRLAQLSKKISDRLSEKYQQQFDLTVPEWRILVHLADKSCADNPSVSAKIITREASLDKSTASRAIQTLLTKGFVLKQGDPVDKRAHVLLLSTTGWSLYEKVAPLVLEWEREMLASLEPQQLENFLAVLDKLDTYITNT
ncbi:MarR family winged helix-turn-helix transcriptional regulator [Shewanella waksmanii]|uniref:MarR family winged helix-turn-helix transcriptional regulator n=1 Tax=Shewanella waksmanii TaxID=213783 RepID=UPI00373658C1